MYKYKVKSHTLEKLTFWIIASIGYGWWVGSLHLICWIKNYHIVHHALANLMSVKFQPWNGWCLESGNLHEITETKYPSLVNAINFIVWYLEPPWKPQSNKWSILH